MRVLITGDRGFIGTHLKKRFPEWVGLDLKAGEDIMYTPRKEGIDAVIHLAAQPGVISSVENPEYTTRQNVMATVRLLKQYQDVPFVFASSGGTVQKVIISPYGMSKYACEEYIKILHDNYRILRFPNVYGPGSRSVVDKFMNTDGPVTIYGNGQATRTYGHIDDICDAIVMSIGWNTGTYKLGSTDHRDNLSVMEIAVGLGKEFQIAPERPGELMHSSLPKEAPNWWPKNNLLNYITKK